MEARKVGKKYPTESKAKEAESKIPLSIGRCCTRIKNESVNTIVEIRPENFLTGV